MRLADVVIGEEYVISDGNGRRRRIKALAVETRQKQFRNNVTGNLMTKDERVVKIKFMDTATSKSLWDGLASQTKGTTTLMRANELLSLWADVADEIKKEHECEQKTVELQKEFDRRLRKLNLQESFYITVRDDTSAYFNMYGSSLKTVDRLLTLLEKGKGIS